MHTIAIIGGGFAGTMTAVHLMDKADFPLHIIIINNRFPLIKGIAYSTHYAGHLLNVPADSISAFNQPEDHFLNWLAKHNDFKQIPYETLKDSFAPRKAYAEYLEAIWANALVNKNRQVNLQLIEDQVTNITTDGRYLQIELSSTQKITTDYAVLATGNAIPKNPPVADASFYASKAYFKNPWDDRCMQNLKSAHDILIIGNSLTMIDAVVSLLENGFGKNIYTVSPHGFAILSDHPAPAYDRDILSEIARPFTLYNLVKTVNKHMKRCTRKGVSRIAVINNLRPHLQQIWADFSLDDRRYFLKRISSLWNAWRHRTPAGMYQKISSLVETGKLTTVTGRLVSLTEHDTYIGAVLHDKKTGQQKTLKVERVINCTGSQIDVQLPGSLLNTLYNNGLITPDPLGIAVNADPLTGAVINQSGDTSTNIYTLGNNLKGVLWETTGIPEIRAQAENLALKLLEQIAQPV